MLKAQENDPKQGDWVTSVKKDLRKLNMKFTMNEIKNMSKFTFKHITKEACEQAALKNLKMQIKTKGNKISYEQLEMQNYLKADSDLNLEEKKMTFKIRTEMTDLKMNMKNKHDKYTCVACEVKDEITNETQEHVYICKNINKEDMAKCEFKEIFSNKRCTENTKYVVKRFQRILKCREQIVKNEKKETDKNHMKINT